MRSALALSLLLFSVPAFLQLTTSQAAGAEIGSRSRDFIQPGTQPFPVPPGLTDAVRPAADCAGCHGNFDPQTAPFDSWVASQKAQSARNPMFWATLAIFPAPAASSAARAAATCPG
jgi:hypothetical protein